VNRIFEVFCIAFRLGLTAFGGPVAHVGFFREEYVAKRKWLTEERFAELMAVTQFLPGPGSSQLGAAIGYERAGWLGGFTAWFAFTLPSAVVLMLFAIGIDYLEPSQLYWIKGLMIAALAVVINASIGMQRKLCGIDIRCNVIAVVSFLLLFFLYAVWMQPLVILVGGFLGLLVFTNKNQKEEIGNSKGGKKQWILTLTIIAVVGALPYVLSGSDSLQATGGIFQAGSLVFGGGHVVLPMLSAEVVDPGFIGKEEFAAGYGMTQAMPGPVFTFAGYLGAKMQLFGNAWLGGAIGIVSIFLPGMMLLAGFVPIWDRFKTKAWARTAMRGANAAVVGLLVAAVVKLLISAGLNYWWEWLVVVLATTVLFRKLIPVWALVLILGSFGFLLYAP